MKNFKRRINNLENKVAEGSNPLYSIRSDLKPILELKREADLMNRYNNGQSNFYKCTKEEGIEEICKEIKNLIIELGEKYKEEA
jgi:hypothetical protein